MIFIICNVHFTCAYDQIREKICNLHFFTSDASELQVDEMKNILRAANVQASGMLEGFEQKCKHLQVSQNSSS